MEMDNECPDCPQQDACQSIYEKLGQNKGPNVSYSIVLVFLLPILIFIAGLIVCKKLLGLGENIGLSALISAIITITYVALASKLIKHSTKKQNQKFCNKQEI